MPSSYTADLPNDILLDTGVLYYSNGNGTYARAGLAKDTVPEDFKTTRTALYEISGVKYSKAPTSGLSFTAGHVVTASKFGIILLQINAAGTISSKVPATPQAYNTAALALAALPAPDALNVALGYIEIANNALDWTANTDDLTDGSDLTTADFTDSIGGMVKFGATRGGLTFNENAEWRGVEYDGASGETAGLDRKTGGVPTIEGTILMVGPSNILALLPGATSAISGVDPNAIQTITPLPHRTMLSATSDYRRWECVWKRGNGGSFGVTFPLGRAVFSSISSQDNNEGEVPIVVRAVNDPADLIGNDEVPAAWFPTFEGPDVTVA